MRFLHANQLARMEGLEPLCAYSHYFLGRTEKQWFRDIPHFGRLRTRNVYPGIDAVYYGADSSVEYDLFLKPGADPNQIEIAYDQVDRIRIDATGDLILAAGGHEVRQHQPQVRQGDHEIPAAYQLLLGNRVRLVLGNYDRSHELTIDPTLEFSTYLGGPGLDSISQVVLDASGNIVLAGTTQTPASPSLDPFQQPSLVRSSPFTIKLTPDARRVLFYSVLGSDGNTTSVALDGGGNLFLTGATNDPSFPLRNAFVGNYEIAYGAGFTTKLSADGRSVIYSSYLGGAGNGGAGTSGTSVTADVDGNAYVTGYNYGGGVPVKSAFQPNGAGAQDCVLTKLSPSGTPVFATYFGGSGIDGCS
jgi:hypothetical protein